MKSDESSKSAGVRAPRWRRWGRWLLIVSVALVFLNLSVRLLSDWCYRGPGTLSQVALVMPGVPIFPLSELASTNKRVQRALAIPIWYMRLQGAKRVEAAEFKVPGDPFFIVDWYRQLAPSQQWKLAIIEQGAKLTRMIFYRHRDGLQVLVGSSEGIFTSVQLIYIQGMTAKQLADLTRGVIAIAEQPKVKPRTPIITKPIPVPVTKTPAIVAKPVTRPKPKRPVAKISPQPVEIPREEPVLPDEPIVLPAPPPEQVPTARPEPIPVVKPEPVPATPTPPVYVKPEKPLPEPTPKIVPAEPIPAVKPGMP